MEKDDNTTSDLINSQEQKERQTREKLRNALLLKDYAINSNLDVPDDVIQKLNHVAASTAKHLLPKATDVDTAIRDLTTVTYPTTVETIALAGARRKSTTMFLIALLVTGVITLCTAIWAFNKDSLAEDNSVLWTSIVAACLGLLGSLVYIFFNLIGVMVEKAFSGEDGFSHSIRLVLGAIVGWVLYFAFGQKGIQDQSNASVLLLLPFVAGFSTRLVFGLINQAIRAIELTLNLEDKPSKLMIRRARAGKKQRDSE